MNLFHYKRLLCMHLCADLCIIIITSDKINIRKCLWMDCASNEQTLFVFDRGLSERNRTQFGDA